MILTLTTTHEPATELGRLLGTQLDRVRRFELPFGDLHVFYPEAQRDRCTAAIVLDVGPLRRRAGANPLGLGHCAPDRSYLASSFLAAGLDRAFQNVITAPDRRRAEPAVGPIPLRAQLTALPCGENPALVRHLFEPLGYQVATRPIEMERLGGYGGHCQYQVVELAGVVELSDLLRHLIVLLPVLDVDKQYFIGEPETRRLYSRGQGWLDTHPLGRQIELSYCRERRDWTRVALRRLRLKEVTGGGTFRAETDDDSSDLLEQSLEKTLDLGALRMAAVVRLLLECGARSVIDLGCGKSHPFELLGLSADFQKVVGVEVSTSAVERIRCSPGIRARRSETRGEVDFFQGSLTYRDERLANFDAACAMEVVEHLDPARIGAFERIIFEFATPRTVIITTPNREYNVRFDGMMPHQLRHPDHRFEWTRFELERWARAVAGRHGYRVRFESIGPDDPNVGPPTQMAIFRRKDRGAAA